MRKLLVLASVLALTATLGYVGTQRVEGKGTEQPASDRQTGAVVEATTAFLKTLNADQRQKVQFAFVPQKVGTIAKFHRTADGGVAPGAPAGGQQGGGRGGPGGGPGMGPPGGFIGEQYGQAIWSISRSATCFGRAFVLVRSQPHNGTP